MNNTLNELPLESLISVPLLESINAQNILNNNGLASIYDHMNNDGTFKTVKFEVDIPDGKKTLELPTIAFYEPNFLSISLVNVGFDIAITGMDKKEQINGLIDSDYNFKGKLSTNSELDIKYKFNIIAESRQTNIGIIKLQHFLSNCITTSTK